MIRQIKFLPVKHGGFIDTGLWGGLGLGGSHVYLGFKPAGGRKLEGWLVFAVNPAEKHHPKRVATGAELTRRQASIAKARAARS